MAIFAVHESGVWDCVPGYVSVFLTYDDAYAAAGELQAMDPEAFYSVETIEESELQEFWFHNVHLELA
jgi:allophanate hydrolase subunit 1